MKHKKLRTLSKRESRLHPGPSESFQCPCPIADGMEIYEKLPSEIQKRIDRILYQDPDIWYIDLIIPEELNEIIDNKCKCNCGIDKESCRYTIRLFKNFKCTNHKKYWHYIKNLPKNPKYMGYYTNNDIEYLKKYIECRCCERHQQNRGILDFSGKKGIYYVRSCYADGCSDNILDIKENHGFKRNKNKIENAKRNEANYFKSKKKGSKKKGIKISKRSGKKQNISADNFENNEYNNFENNEYNNY